MKQGSPEDGIHIRFTASKGRNPLKLDDASA